MARSVDTIYDQMVSNLVTGAATIGITIDPTQWSRRNLLRLICYVVAIAIATFEQNYDQFKADTEAIVNKLAPQTNAWFQAQAFKFQYNVLVPQIVQLKTTTLTPYYTLVNTDYQIIKFCSVTSGGGGSVLVKCAAAGPTALTTGGTGELAAFQSYLNQISTPGISIIAVSRNADEIYIEASIYYIAQYAAIISDNVIAAINAYLAGIPFDGKVLLTDIEQAILSVEGVTDVFLGTTRARAATDTFPAGVSLRIGSTDIQRSYSTVAGYIIPETTTGNELTDTLTFIPE
jgi:hypothetical protein